MPNALLTGVSGLLAHQRLLEVVGHNIANVNTVGYKTGRALFSDLLYETIQPATSASDDSLGGTNPMQVGQGVKVGMTDRKFSQGSLDNTGETFDLAMEGSGFFVVSDGTSDFYTRAGNFSLDENEFLVSSSGLTVQRFPGIGEPDGVNPSFQIPGDNRVRVPLGTSVPGQKSSEVAITGNISSLLSPAVATVKSAVSPFKTAGGDATDTTLLNDLILTSEDYVSGDVIELTGVDADGTDVTPATLSVDGTTTVGDLVSFIDSSFPGVTARLQGGKLVMTADETGSSDFILNLTNADGNTGRLQVSSFGLKSDVKGSNAQTFPTSVVIYDERGGSHTLDLEFFKVDDNTWRMTGAVSAASGVVTDNVVEEIRFAEDGTLSSTSDPTMSIQINGLSAPQNIIFKFNGENSSDTLTHYKSGSSVRSQADGYEAGTLVSVNVEGDGRVQGIASNGKIFELAQLTIANFGNPKGLVANGNGVYSQTLNSGVPDIGLAGTGARGVVRSGALEGSNVDLAFEFTRLIVAQRGFSANARTVTVSDEVLEELTNIVR